MPLSLYRALGDIAIRGLLHSAAFAAEVDNLYVLLNPSINIPNLVYSRLADNPDGLGGTIKAEVCLHSSGTYIPPHPIV